MEILMGIKVIVDCDNCKNREDVTGLLNYPSWETARDSKFIDTFENLSKMKGIAEHNDKYICRSCQKLKIL